ncbi:MAG: insulinase family protein [Acidobacteriota bacterium]|nr:MAG: insulinase family protein [Acidobacteriota bacterium]
MNFRFVDVERHRFDNGLTVLIRPDRSVPITTSMIWYRVGSSSELPGQRGICHFIEHMLFKGTKRFGKGAIDYITTQNGGFNNAFTAHDYTAYFFSFASDRWKQALEIEADRMFNAQFDEAEFDLERQVILEELQMALDDPWDFLRLEMDQAAFQKHPYGQPILGTREDLENMTREALLEFYGTHYVPGNATLVLVGDVETDKALKAVEQTLGKLPSCTVPNLAEARSEQRTQLVRRFLEHPTGVYRMLVAVPAPSSTEADFAEMNVIDRALSEGKLSRLHLRLVEQEHWASFVTTEIEDTREPYLLFIRAELREGVDPGRVESAILEELEELAERPPEGDELERAKNQLIVHFLGDMETTFDQAFQFGLLETLDRWENLNAYLNRAVGVSPEELATAARTYCDRNQAVICHLAPM